MAIHTFNDHGLLDPGIHPMSLDKVGELFGRFQRSDRRLNLMARQREFAAEVWAVDDRIRIVVDGSFIMPAVDEPEDIDVVLILPPEWDMAADLPPFAYNMVSPRMVRRRYRFDMLLGIEGQPSALATLGFFAQVIPKWIDRFGLPPGTYKGLVRIEL